MFRSFVRLLPLCFVAWAARRWCSSQHCGGSRWHQPFDDILILTAEELRQLRAKHRAAALRRQIAVLQIDFNLEARRMHDELAISKGTAQNKSTTGVGLRVIDPSVDESDTGS